MEQVWKKEKESHYSRQINEKFFAQKKQHQQANDVSTKTCFECNQVRHAASKCLQNPKAIYVEKERKIRRFETENTQFCTKQFKVLFQKDKLG
ncbi:putative transcription factor interactor and regulator CCHC(Zn) family [Helianthus anomalus]